MKLDYSKIENIRVANIDIKDAPDFSDAFIESADYEGRPMTDEELDELNADSDFVHLQVQNKIY